MPSEGSRAGHVPTGCWGRAGGRGAAGRSDKGGDGRDGAWVSGHHSRVDGGRWGRGLVAWLRPGLGGSVSCPLGWREGWLRLGTHRDGGEQGEVGRWDVGVGRSGRADAPSSSGSRI